MSRKKSMLLGACAALGIGVLPAPPAQAAPDSPQPGQAVTTRSMPAAADASRVDPAARDRILPAGWRTSTDVAWTTQGDATGFHVLVAEARTGYAWRTAATLAESWIEADQWVGNACVTGSGRRAVVTYAPRHFTNRGHLFDRGAFAAVVDLASGAVTKLDATVSLAYYNPGCGTGETAVLTQGGAADLGRTRLHLVDTTRGRRVRTHDLPGEVTSAVPVRDRIVAALGAQLAEIDPAGSVRRLTGTSGVPYRVHPDATGGVLFTERVGATGMVKRLSGSTIRELARGPLTGIRTKSGSGGRVFLVGTPTRVSALPPSVTRLAAPVDAEVSTTGQLTLTHDTPTPGAARRAPRPEPGSTRAVTLDARVTATGAAVRFGFDPADRIGGRPAAGRTTSPAAAPTGRATGRRTTGRTSAAESPTDPVDNDRTCSIPRNDPRLQVYQPHWSQVEWAADLAVQGALTIIRPANWKRSGMPVSWSPQQMFPPVGLAGGGRVPAQVLLGVLAQESNLWQASFHAVEGVTGNPLIGSYYGGAEDGWAIDWASADCGYGVAQITDGMRLPGKGQPTLPPERQRAIAADYATNIAAGLRILQQKWNETFALNVRVNRANPAAIESWFAALWAYNSGINPQASTGNTSGCTPGPSCTDADGNYGLGWTNNPARPDFPPDRAPFLDHDHYDDARNPQWWPYPEKVIGWAAYPIVKATGGRGYEAGYDQAWWNTEELRSGAKPPLQTFCSTDPTNGNNCNPANIGRSANPCTRSDFHCWWHAGVEWKDCAASTQPCGHESDSLTPPGRPEPPDADAPGAYADESRPRYAPNCSLTGLPAGALVIDDVPDSVPVVRPNCVRSWTSAGTFGLSFAQHTDGLYHSKVDFHQIGGGFGGHFWFTHSRTPSANASRNWAVTGTWTLNSTLSQWARVLVHMPDHGAHTQQAAYTVHLGNGQSKRRVVLQKTQRHQWVSLGTFPFAGRPSVSLNSLTEDGDGSQDIAWDAIAFVPLPGKPTDQIVVLGDSFSSGEGAAQNAAADYYQETDDSGTGGSAYRNGCHRSRHAWSRQLVLPGRSESVGALADRFDPTLDHHLLACSGAETENLLPGGAPNAFGDPGRGQYKEVSQLDRGFLDEHTTLVMLTIGGNDAHFSDVMRLCTSETPGPLQLCQNEFVPGNWLGTDPPTVGTLASVLP
ncbi:MAG TPA: SGNH/GDSL hydrolase family protein, partial [Actinoplanes sp.]|nr:SGNH/GDSL hydrolase family protein [Actinoplanes sp.]